MYNLAMYQLPKLAYSYDALEPQIDARTMEIHHTKHHQGYVDKLNTALEKYPDLQQKPLRDLLRDLNSVPADIRTAVRNNGGGHLNHSLFWETLGPARNSGPGSELVKLIKRDFTGFSQFQEQFSSAAISLFGSGWVWLVKDGSTRLTINGSASSPQDGSGKLLIKTIANQDSPVMEGLTPILGLDVWEHAYYLKYQNRRPDYVAAWWQVINWEAVSWILGRES